MKKVLVFALVAIVSIGVVSASDLNVGVKGIAGVDNSGNKGPLLGGGIDVAYQFGNHFGVAVEADACGANFTVDDGLKVQDNFYLSVPVMLYYSYDIDRIEIDLGAGLSNVFRHDSISIDLAGGLKATYWVEDWGISIGATGTIDCLPSLVSRTNADGTRTYQMKKSDGKNSSLLCSIGVSYRFNTSNV